LQPFRRLRQIFINLLSNAMKFTPAGGSIDIVVEENTHGGVTITFSDTGIGMSPEDVTLAMEPFAQVDGDFDKSYQGAGLGLPLAKRLIELHGGMLVIQSIKGDGTSVRVTLPLVEEQTKLQAANIELAESRDRAEAASRAKSLFLANMSHELRTPLNAVIGFSELIKEERFGPVGERYTGYACDIHDAGKHLLKIIDDVLDTAKIEAGTIAIREKWVDLREVIKLSADPLRVAIGEKQLTFACQFIGPTPSPVYADPLRLKQVFINLLSNAMKFTPAGGSIDIVVEENTDGGVTITFSDTGIGMSPEDVTLAMVPFAQVDGDFAKSYQGAGLGLPLAKRLVELHGGTLIIESTKGDGTSVRVTLPAERLRTPQRRASSLGEPAKLVGSVA
jgi:signal transduction histidine kinase